MDDVDAVHRHSIRHRAEIQASERCGCFYCLATFAPSEIVEWTDCSPDGPDGSESCETALCPNCGIDSVIGSASGAPTTPEFLARMEARWFGKMGRAN